jgi:hypothetical protein
MAKIFFISLRQWIALPDRDLALAYFEFKDDCEYEAIYGEVKTETRCLGAVFFNEIKEVEFINVCC